MTASPHNGQESGGQGAGDPETWVSRRDPLTGDAASPPLVPSLASDVMAAAWAWHVAIDLSSQPDEADWEGFGAWLEASPDHRTAYDAVTLIDRMLDEHRPALAMSFGEGNASSEAAPEALAAFGRSDAEGRERDDGDTGPQRRWSLSRRGRDRRREEGGWRGIGRVAKGRLGFGVLAAASVAAVLILSLNVSGLTGALFAPSETTYTTTKGETRLISLAQGISVELAPASRLIVTGDGDQRLQLASGSAFFKVDHRPDRLLRVRAGDYDITDIGTRFTVDHANGAVMVQVSEGRLAVRTQSGGNTNQVAYVAAGQQWAGDRASGAGQFSAIPVGDVGSWRYGRLVYSDAPVALVAADLARYSGKVVKLAPALGGRRFSGVLTIGDGSKLLETFAGLMGASLDSDGGAVLVRPSVNP